MVWLLETDQQLWYFKSPEESGSLLFAFDLSELKMMYGDCLDGLQPISRCSVKATWAEGALAQSVICHSSLISMEKRLSKMNCPGSSSLAIERMHSQHHHDRRVCAISIDCNQSPIKRPGLSVRPCASVQALLCLSSLCVTGITVTKWSRLVSS